MAFILQCHQCAIEFADPVPEVGVALKLPFHDRPENGGKCMASGQTAIYFRKDERVEPVKTQAR